MSKWKTKGLFVPASINHDGTFRYSREQIEQLKSVYHKGWENPCKVDVAESANVAPEMPDPMPLKPSKVPFAAPSALVDIPRWVLHKNKTPKTFNPKAKNPRLFNTDCTKTGVNFLDFNTAVSAVNKFGNKVDGIGFALDKNAIKAVCIDIDDPTSDAAKQLLETLKNTYIERSPSGKGFHIWFLDNDISGISGRRLNGLEIYADKHFLTFTGDRLDNAATDLIQLDGYAKRILFDFFANDLSDQSVEKLIANTDFDAPPAIDDDQLLSIIKNSNDAEAKKLLIEGNANGYKSPSEADWHLVLKLCFWTAGNAGQIERLCYKSPLANREKWQERQDYRRRTIVKALAVWDGQAFNSSAKSLASFFKFALHGLSYQFRNPSGFAVKLGKGIFKFDDENNSKCICNDVILPVRFFSNADNYTMKVELAFQKHNSWHSSVFDFDILTISKNIVELGKLGLDVNSINAREMIAFFRSFNSSNRDAIAVITAFSQSGWRNDGSFVYPVDNPDYIIDAGRDIDVIDMFKPHGERNDWLETYNAFKKFTYFRLAVSAALAAPMLKILRMRNMSLQFWSQSGEGKTAILKFADSVFKNPLPLLKFSATKSFIEARCVALSDFPICVDELKTAELSHKAANTIDVFAHLIESGASKGRATKEVNQRAVKLFRTIAIITGEHPLSSFNSDMGVKRRVLELHCRDIFPNEPHAAECLHRFAEDNYGLVGQEWLEIVTELGRADSFRDKYQEFKRIIQTARPDAFADHCNLLAACATADFFFNKEIAEPYVEPDSELLLQIEDDFSVEEEQKDSVRAFDFVTDWLAQNKGMFAIDGKNDVHSVKYGWIVERGTPKEAFAVIPSVLKQALDNAGFNPNKTLKELANDGFIESYQQKDKKSPNFTIMQWIKNEGSKRVIKIFSSKFSSISPL